MKTDTRDKILKIIEENGSDSPGRLARTLGISTQAIHRHLKKLVQSGEISRHGTPPSVFYKRVYSEERENRHTFPELERHLEQVLQKNYFYVAPSGERLSGVKGFQSWCLNTNQHSGFRSLAKRYCEQQKTLEKHFVNGLVPSLHKIRSTFERSYLDGLVYQDFWSIPQFGKTRLGHFVTLGKSGQRIDAVQLLAEWGVELIEGYIKQNKIQAVAFAPHSITRKLNFLKTYAGFLNLKLPHVAFVKASLDGTPVAQKTLTKLSERVKNARDTLFVKDSQVPFEKVLIIDDALGSGATMNELAKKLKEKSVSQVFGFAIVGSYKGFEVIPEV